MGSSLAAQVSGAGSSSESAASSVAWQRDIRPAEGTLNGLNFICINPYRYTSTFSIHRVVQQTLLNLQRRVLLELVKLLMAFLEYLLLHQT